MLDSSDGSMMLLILLMDSETVSASSWNWGVNNEQESVQQAEHLYQNLEETSGRLTNLSLNNDLFVNFHIVQMGLLAGAEVEELLPLLL